MFLTFDPLERLDEISRQLEHHQTLLRLNGDHKESLLALVKLQEQRITDLELRCDILQAQYANRTTTNTADIH